MRKSVLLDTGVLSLVTHPRKLADAQACRTWIEGLLRTRFECVIPEICDYELRRELLRAGKEQGIRNLDRLASRITYLAIDTATMREAAALWSTLRNQGRPTASDQNLDADVILGAQAKEHERRGTTVVVATTNVRHLCYMCDARHWQDIG